MSCMMGGKHKSMTKSGPNPYELMAAAYTPNGKAELKKKYPELFKKKKKKE